MKKTAERAIQPRIDLKQLERQARAECQPIMDEMARIHAISVRPTFIRNGRIEYGPYPPATQAYLDDLLAMGRAIIDRYKKLAEGEQEPQ